jgi:hypothetical protein
MPNSVASQQAEYTRFGISQGVDAGEPTARHGSPPALRFLERFALLAFGLYHVPFFLNNYPSLGGGGFSASGLAARWGRIFTVPGIWVARHVLGIGGRMPGSDLGDNGDVAEEFGRVLICVVVGIIGAAVWTLADRRKPRARWVPETLRVMLRYSIALGLASYAIGKILPLQFPPLRAAQLEQRLGDLPPMQLLWTFMEYSRPYAFFGGLMECIVVALLCFRRTATLGALMCLAVMTNVALLNYAYDVPVKLFATMIVLSAAVLVAYDAPRLVAVFLTNRAVAANAEPSPIHERIPRAWRWAIKSFAVGSVVVSSVVAMLPIVRARAKTGTFDDASVKVTARHVDAPYVLLRDRFHLIAR